MSQGRKTSTDFDGKMKLEESRILHSTKQ